MAFIRRYVKRLERKFSRKSRRKGFNFQCDVYLASRVRAIARHLEVPIYPLMEEIIECGLSEIVEIMQDSALREGLENHLIAGHLLVKHLDPESETVSRQATRLRTVMELLKVVDMFGVTSDDFVRALKMAKAGAR